MQNTKKIIQYFPAYKTSNPSTKNLKQAIDKKNSINALMKQKIKKKRSSKNLLVEGQYLYPSPTLQMRIFIYNQLKQKRQFESYQPLLNHQQHQ